MGKIFDTQTYLRIKLTYTADVAASVSSVKIKYRDADDVVGEWDATHVPADKYVYYDLPTSNAETLGKGRWRFWIYAIMDDTRILIGEVADELIHEEGIDKK